MNLLNTSSFRNLELINNTKLRQSLFQKEDSILGRVFYIRQDNFIQVILEYFDFGCTQTHNSYEMTTYFEFNPVKLPYTFLNNVFIFHFPFHFFI